MKKKRKHRVIELLRRDNPGNWRYDQDAHQWIREDGLKVYALAHFSPGENGSENWYSRWYVEKPNGSVELYGGHGALIPLRLFQGGHE